LLDFLQLVLPHTLWVCFCVLLQLAKLQYFDAANVCAGTSAAIKSTAKANDKILFLIDFIFIVDSPFLIRILLFSIVIRIE